MKHLKIFENYNQEMTIVEKIRVKCNRLQSEYLLSRNDEKLTELQYFQTLIHTIDNAHELTEKDKYEIEKLNN